MAVAAETIRRVFTTRYGPDLSERGFLSRAQTQTGELAEVTLAAPDPDESASLFGVPLARKGVQPVHLRITNRSGTPLRLQMVAIDRAYFTPVEAAAVSRFSLLKRMLAMGAMAWLILPFLIVIPSRLVTAWRANRRMERLFRSVALRLRPLPPGATVEGFVFATYGAGTREITVRLLGAGGSLSRVTDAGGAESGVAPAQPTAEFVFSVPIAGIKADHLRRDFSRIHATTGIQECSLDELSVRLRSVPVATTNRRGTGSGDPMNLVVIGEYDTILSAFAGGWDETEAITAATCLKTARAFLLGSEYRYSPVSSLYVDGRSQDLALQRVRDSINERLHLRLWLAPLRFDGVPVWVGQVSRDIGVRFTHRTWNLTTHRIDPDVDESREYVVEALLDARRVHAVGYVDGVGACEAASPRRNLTGDPYYTDGRRAVIYLSTEKVLPRFVAFSGGPA